MRGVLHYCADVSVVQLMHVFDANTQVMLPLLGSGSLLGHTEVEFLHSAHSAQDIIFLSELAALARTYGPTSRGAASSITLSVRVFVSHGNVPRGADTASISFHQGRLQSRHLLAAVEPGKLSQQAATQPSDLFLCGPEGFMKQVNEWLSDQAVTVYTESFAY